MPTLLADCNSFYASCERVFDPALRNRPVVVLSNNDGCVISRSQEAKDVGVEMGAPAFQCEALFHKFNVAVRSANFPLYGDMSRRVMQILAEFSPNIEIYSIDEAFLSFPATPGWQEEATALAREARKRIDDWTGIPISIGIATTKTLAKLSNREAKRHPEHDGVFCIESLEQPDRLLATIPVGQIWGIGHRRVPVLNRRGIDTVLDLKRADPAWVLRNLTITGLRTQRELNGAPCLMLEEVAPRHTVLCSRSFGRAITDYADLREATASFAARAAEKLRQHKRAAGMVQVWVRFRTPHDNYGSYAASEGEPEEELPPPPPNVPAAGAVGGGSWGGWYAGRGRGTSESATVTLPVATAFTPDLVAAAHRALEAVYRPGCGYKKAGVLLADLCPADAVQLDLFEARPPEPGAPNRRAQAALMRAVDRLNREYGERTVFVLGTGIDKGAAKTRTWQGKRQHCSPRYTTSWDELFTVGDGPGDKEPKSDA